MKSLEKNKWHRRDSTMERITPEETQCRREL
jgi:hypothetical protein